MKWKRQARWLFCIGIVLLIISSGALIGLYLMNARATPSPSPNAGFFGLEQWTDTSSDEDDGFVTVDWDYWKEIHRLGQCRRHEHQSSHHARVAR